jgi:hypothetical protein
MRFKMSLLSDCNTVLPREAAVLPAGYGLKGGVRLVTIR